MNTPLVAIAKDTLVSSRSIETFQTRVATYYANILYSHHLHGKEMRYEFPLVLAGIVVAERELQPHLKILLGNKLGVNDIGSLDFIYTPFVRIIRKKNKKTDKDVSERYLRITVKILDP